MTGFYTLNLCKKVRYERYLVSYPQLLQNVSCMDVRVGPPREDKKNSLELAGFEPATFCTFE